MKVTVVVGNPKPASRTLDAARALVHSLTAGLDEVDAEIVDVVALGSGLLGWGDRKVAQAVATVSGSDLIVVASPTFKATYSGLLKLFLDQFAGDTGMKGVVAIPLMLGAGPAHAMAPDLFLRHVLVELGAVVPAPGLYLIDTSYTSDTRIEDYTTRWGSAVLCATRVGSDVS